jgi:hypothetical protein
MPEQQLNRSEILGSPVDQGSLGTTRLGDPRDRLESAGSTCDRLAAPARPRGDLTMHRSLPVCSRKRTIAIWVADAHEAKDKGCKDEVYNACW